MTRLPNWPGLLDRFINDNRQHPFAYGSFDCCLWVANCIEVMTEVDLAAGFRGRYESREEAVRIIEEITGHKSVRKAVEHVTKAHEMEPVEVLYLQRGDMALVKRPRDYSLGIVALNGREVIVSAAGGLEWIPISSACAGWRV